MASARIFIGTILFFTGIVAAAQAVYQDPARSTDERVADLLSRMTLAEKLSQLGNESPGIDHLGIQPYNWSNECLHGVAAPGYSTVFPQAIALAAAWNTPLHHEIASAIGDEVRGHNNEFVRQGNFGLHTGLTCWSPNINIFRDPRWGRGQETYGEDPYLTGQLAVAFIRGLQGDDPRYLKAIATAKHFAVHSGPEPLRHEFDAQVDGYDLADTYLGAFESAIRGGGAQSVMCSYNRVKGVPMCANQPLLDGVLRGHWGFQGYVVSDCGAVGDIFSGHHSAPTLIDAAAMAFNAGTDLACGDEYEQLTPAVNQGLVTTARVDQALGRLLAARFKLGMFDPPALVPYTRVPMSEVDSPAHSDLAFRSAREAIVLLKNRDQILPLKKSLKSVAVIGPNAASADVLLGNYNGTPSKTVTLLEGIQRKLGPDAKVEYAAGSALYAGQQTVAPARMLFHTERGEKVPGLVGEYFNGMALAGTPVLTRTDKVVDFDFQNSPPLATFPTEQFSVRWTGWIVPPVTADYLLGVNSDDGSRLYLDDQLLVDMWSDHSPMTQTKRVTLQAGHAYAVRLEYYQNKGGATVSLLATDPDDSSLINDALAVARNADAVVLGLGISPQLEGEEMPVEVEGFSSGDRTNIDLPAPQEKLLRAVMALGKPTVLVLMNGSALAINWADQNVPGILEAWYPGQRGGDAIADVLFGDYNPAGRLPVTFYRSTDQLPPFTSYAMEGRTYRYFSGKPLYPFGFGLSYTHFAYRGLQLTRSVISKRDSVHLSVDVSNTGALGGDEVVEVYVTHLQPKQRAPIRALRAFQRIHLDAGTHQTVAFTLSPEDFELSDLNSNKTVPAGAVSISVGGKQPGFFGGADAATTEVVSTGLTIRD